MNKDAEWTMCLASSASQGSMSLCSRMIIQGPQSGKEPYPRLPQHRILTISLDGRLEAPQSVWVSIESVLTLGAEAVCWWPPPESSLLSLQGKPQTRPEKVC